ncbi:MAG: AAA family ATPase [Nitrospirales bacterium]|nr:AAA family ATPase [Nitrospirales bacterium]
MKNDVVQIRDKTVHLSQPYRAAVGEIVGREQEMTRVLAAWMSGTSSLPLAPLLLGEPGVGKNRIVYECARLCALDLYICQGHEDITAEDLICSVRFSDDPGKKMDYIVSPLVSAMLRGGICFLDEIAKIRPRALAPLVSVLDERRYLDSTLLGERVYAHPAFRFVAATNSDDVDESPLPGFIHSRLRPVITVEGASREEIDLITKGRFPSMETDRGGLLDQFWALWDQQGGGRPPTPRDSLYVFGYAINLANFEMARGSIPCHVNEPGGSRMTKEHLVRAFEAFHDHGDRTGEDHPIPDSSLAQP